MQGHFSRTITEVARQLVVRVYRKRKVYILVARWLGGSAVTTKLPSNLK